VSCGIGVRIGVIRLTLDMKLHLCSFHLKLNLSFQVNSYLRQQKRCTCKDYCFSVRFHKLLRRKHEITGINRDVPCEC